jgi:hypothetical protein
MRPITYDPRAARAPLARFDVRSIAVPTVTRSRVAGLVRFAFALYVAQAVGGALVGFAVPFLQLAGVF